MNEIQFQIIVDLLKMIEYNTSIVRLEIEEKESPYRKHLQLPTDSNVSPPISPFFNDAINQVREVFYAKLEKKTGWGRPEIRRLLEESITSMRCPSTDECPF